MCAIIDASGANDVFGKDRPEIGVAFFNWIEEQGYIVTGGKLTMEIGSLCQNFLDWAREAERVSKLIIINNSKIHAEIAEVVKIRGLRSNDAHVLAIARISGARLLYANDGPLLEDFINSRVITRPAGDTMTSSTGDALTNEDRETLVRATERCRQQALGRD